MKNFISRGEFLRVAPILGGAALVSACAANNPRPSLEPQPPLRRVTILHTNDEHGWLLPGDGSGGATGILARWRAAEGLGRDPNLLVLSSGDLWIGPALSTWFAGQSTIDIMNRMGYQAAAIGNHDFDNGVEALRQRAAEASFPFLSANILQAETGGTPDFARPYAILTVNQVRVGLIGLTTIDTPTDTPPQHVAQYRFLLYEEALRRATQLVRAEGADLIVLLGHICTSELRALAPAARGLGISIMFGGHCHENTNETVEGVLLIQSGYFWRGYTRIDLAFDPQTGSVERMEAAFRRIESGPEDLELKRKVTEWRDQSDPALWKVIGYARRKIGRDSAEMSKLLGQAWLAAYPAAQVTLASPRYIQHLLPGDLSVASMLSMLPIQNQLVAVDLRGEALLSVIADQQPLVGGLAWQDRFTFPDGTALDPGHVYRVLLPEMLYRGCNGYAVAQFASGVVETGIDSMQSVVDWVAAQRSSRWSPLEVILARE